MKIHSVKSWISFALIVCLCLGTMTGALAAPDEVIDPFLNGHTYAIFDDAETWEEAALKCEERGGYLATLTSWEENVFVYRYMKSLGIKSAYFGLSDAETEGTWKWITGEPLEYTDWEKEAPDSLTPDEDYAMFYYKYSSAYWNDGDFGVQTDGGTHYICEWDPQFMIGRHNNSFTNSSETEDDGFYGVRNYDMTNKYYWDLRNHYTTSEEYFEQDGILNLDMIQDWEGSCYGIAVATALNYNQKLNITKTSKRSAKSYFTMELPWGNQAFLSLIQYYQCSQYLKCALLTRMELAHYTNPDFLPQRSEGTTLDAELGVLVRACRDNPDHVYVLNLGFWNPVKEENHGHSMLVWECQPFWDAEGAVEHYEINAYDVNTRTTSTLRIAGDFSNFWIMTGSGSPVGSAELDGTDYYYNYIGFLDPDSMPITVPYDVQLHSVDGPYVPTEMEVTLPMNGVYTVTAPDGSFLHFNGTGFEGDMKLYNMLPIHTSGEKARMRFLIDRFDSLEWTSEQGDTDIFIGGYPRSITLAGSNIQKATLMPSGSVEITGTNASFHTFIHGFGSFAMANTMKTTVGCANGTTRISLDSEKLTINGDSELQDVELRRYYSDRNYSALELPDAASHQITDADLPPYLPYDCMNNSVRCASLQFTDAPSYGHWAHRGIDYAIERQLFNGMSPTTFGPNVALTRAMLVTILWRNENYPSGYTHDFIDVRPDQWYTKAVAWASSVGIVNGMGNNRFNPNYNLTREQLATIFYRYSEWRGLDTSARRPLSDFPDGEKVQDWAVEAMEWMLAKGFINGVKTDGRIELQPRSNTTRAQSATILVRYLE